MNEGLTQYYWKQQRSFFISKYNFFNNKKCKLLQFQRLKVFLNLQNKNRIQSLTIFWTFFFCLNKKPLFKLKKNKDYKLSLIKLNFNLNKDLILLEKIIIDLISYTDIINIKFKIKLDSCIIKLYSIAEYAEIENLYIKTRIYRKFDFNFNFFLKNVKKKKLLFFLKLYQLPVN